MATTDSTDDLLPVYLSPKERHYRRLRTGLHPTVDWGDTRRDIRSDDHEGIYVEGRDSDRLIGLLSEENRCPVCGERGTLELARGFTFLRGAEDGDFSAGERDQEGKNLGKKLEERGYRTIVCRASGDPDGPGMDYQRMYIGIAHPAAVEAYEEWMDNRKARNAVRSRARALSSESRIGHWKPERAFDGKYDHGDILAAIYELLGVETYDTMDLAGRSNITKSHLAAVLDRLHHLDIQERSDQSAEDWTVHREFGVAQRVQWHIPEWVDAETLEWAESLRLKLFE